MGTPVKVKVGKLEAKKSEALYRCNNANKSRCPDRWRKDSCAARVIHKHNGTDTSYKSFTCEMDGGFACRCVTYRRPAPWNKGLKTATRSSILGRY